MSRIVRAKWQSSDIRDYPHLQGAQLLLPNIFQRHPHYGTSCFARIRLFSTPEIPSEPLLSALFICSRRWIARINQWLHSIRNVHLPLMRYRRVSCVYVLTLSNSRKPSRRLLPLLRSSAVQTKRFLEFSVRPIFRQILRFFYD